MKYLISLCCLVVLSGCATTKTKIEYVELPPKVVKEKVYINCEIPAEFLDKNKVNILPEDTGKEAIRKIAKEYNERGFKLEAIENIECIKKGS